MKKLFLIIFSFIFTSALIACGENITESDNESTTTALTEQSVLEIQTTETQITEQKVKLLYSRSYSNTHDFEEPITLIESYAQYLESGYPLDLDESFFNDYVLYTYSFINANLGTNIYILDDYQLLESNILQINYKHNEGTIIVSPAFGPYAMIFEIEKSLYQSVDNVVVEYS